MTSTYQEPEVSEPQPPRLTLAARAGGAIAVAVVMIAGIFVLGRLASNAIMAMALTTIFFGAVFAVIAYVVWRRRAWLLPLAVPFTAVALVSGVILGAPLVVDDVVNEDVVTASAPAPSAAGDARATAPPGQETVAVADGSFEPLSHPGVGTATLFNTADDGAKLTLTDFATDNGPDVRVYLSRGTDAEGNGESFVDLGALKGNKGNQQYSIPAGLDLTEFDAVVLWCRAFDVGFTQAPLTATT